MNEMNWDEEGTSLPDTTLKIVVEIEGSHSHAYVSEIIEPPDSKYWDCDDALKRLSRRVLFGFFGYELEDVERLEEKCLES